MNLYESLFLNMLFILFPLLVYLFYIVYNRNIGKKENDIYLDLTLVTSLYLSLRFGVGLFNRPILLIFNVPLIVAYVKKRHFSILVMSIIIIHHYVTNLYFKVPLILLEYLGYYVVFLYMQEKKRKEEHYIFFFLIMKSMVFIGCLLTNPVLQEDYLQGSYFSLPFMILRFFVITYVVLFLIKKGEEIMKYHMNVKELEQEKQIRTSLFKITHEIKNPIAVCKGYLDMFDVHNTEHAEKYVPIMKEEINRTLILLQDFLSITKIKVEKDILDINYLLEDVVNSFEPILEKNKVMLDTNLYDDEIYISGDYNRLTQVFINLLKNSVEAMEEKDGGRLSITTLLKDHLVEIQIHDNGMGIEPDVLKKISEPFFTTKLRGTGLGVSLSYEIIAAHEGTIHYESKIGKGTTVTILLPLLEEQKVH